MSDLSVLWHKISGFFAGHPDPTVQAAGQTITNAVDQTEAALPAIVADAANLVIDKIPGGALFEGIADTFIEGVIGALVNKHSNPTAAAAAATAAVPAPAA